MPGEGEEEAANNYYGATTENTAHPWTPAEQTQRARTAIGNTSTSTCTCSMNLLRTDFIFIVYDFVVTVVVIMFACCLVSSVDLSTEVVSRESWSYLQYLIVLIV